MHAKHLGHPLLGDEPYGGARATARTSPLGKACAHDAAAAAALAGFDRPALHAKTLHVTQPASCQRLEFDSELPEDMARLVDALRRVN